MYGATSEHAPNPTRLAGAITAGVATLAFGYAMANGMGRYIASILPDPITYVVLPDEKPADRPPPDSKTLLVSDPDTLTVVTPESNLPDFPVEPPPIAGSTEARDRGPSIPATPTPPHAPIRTRAQMLKYEPPPYPLSEIRKHNEGISGLEVCLDPHGRVTSATLAASSGHPILDQAALKWVRDIKFAPAKLDGVAQAICGHSVAYQWTLKDR